MYIAITKKANEMIKTFENASFGVIDENGYPSVSAVSLSKPETISELHFTTTLDANKAKRLQQNNKASINCFSDTNNITLVGEASILTDQESKNNYWQDWFIHIYPGGKTDPNYCVIKFTAKRASLWIDEEGAEFTID